MKKFIAFLALLVAWLAAPPLANASWTLFFDVTNTTWEQCKIDYKSNSNNTVTKTVAGTLVPGTKIYKFIISDEDPVNLVVYGADQAPDGWGANVKYGEFSYNNGNNDWKVANNRLMVLTNVVGAQGASSVHDGYKVITSCDLYGYPCSTNAGTSYETFCTLSYNETSGKWEGTFTPKHTGDNGKFDLREFWSDETTPQRWRGDYWFDSSHTEYTLNQGGTWNIAINAWVGTELKATYDASTHLLHIEPAVVLPTATYSFSGGTEEANPLVVNTTEAYGFTVTCANFGTDSYNIYYQTWNGSAWVDEQHPYGGTDASTTVTLPAPTEGTDVTYKIRTIIPVSADLGIPGNQIVETRYVNIHYQDPSAGWDIYAICESQPNIWMWGSQGNLFTSFPGPTMTKDTEHGIDNLWYYYYAVDDKNVTGVKFSWGSSNKQFDSGTFKGGVFVLSGSYPTYASLAEYEEAMAPHWYLAYQTDNFDASKVFCELTRQGDTDVWTGTFNVNNQKEAGNGKFYVWGKVNGTYTKYACDGWFTPSNLGPKVLVTSGDNWTNLSVDGYANDAGVLVTLNAGATKTLKLEPYTAVPLNVYPRAVADHNNDWSYLSTTSPAVYVTGRYINNNRLVPDWEMTLVDGKTDKWEITGTLHTNDQLTIHYITGRDALGNATEETYTATPGTGNYSTNGCPVKITYNHSDNSISFEKLNNGLPPFFSLVGLGYKQRLDYATPNVYNASNPDLNKASRGWAESWILYDKDHNPLLDVDGNAIYSSQWPPQNPILFQAVNCRTTDGKPEGETFELDSNDIRFVRDSDRSGTTGKTIAEWKDIFNDATYYSNMFVDAASHDYATDASYNTLNYVRYVIEDAWVLGATKIWSGWSTGINSSNGADWGYFGNLGIKDGSTNTDYAGDEVAPGYTVPVFSSGGNFFFPTGTNFRTLELYLPVSATGEVDMNKALFLTTRNLADVQIKANPEAVEKPHRGRYLPSCSNSASTGLTFKSYRVYRYIYDDAAIAHPDCNKAEDRALWNAANNSAGTNLVIESTTSIEGNTTWFNDTEYLADGRYFYYMEVDFTKGDDIVTVRAASTYFTLQSLGFSPICTPLQLIDINDSFKNATETDAPNSTIRNKYAGKTITYRKLGTGRYYLVDRTTQKATTIEATEAENLIRFIAKNPEYFVWTSDFYVVGQIGSDYEAQIEAGINKGTIDGVSSRSCQVYIKKFDSVRADYSTLNWSDADLAVTSSEDTYKLQGRIFRGNGLLTPPTFVSTIAYSYKTTGDGATTVSETAGDQLAKVENRALTIPLPFHLQYNYSNNEVDQVTMSSELTDEKERKYVEVHTTSSVIPNTDVTLRYYKDSSDDKNAWNVRRLDCHFYYWRPNVAQDIIWNYDIVYDVFLGTNQETTDAQVPGTIISDYSYWTDTAYQGSATDPRTNVRYELVLTDVHPSPTIYPRMRINNAVYKRKTDASETYDANYRYDLKLVESTTLDYVYDKNNVEMNPLYIIAPNYLRSVAPEMGFILMQKVDLDSGFGADYMYAGHRDFVHATGSIGSDTDRSDEQYLDDDTSQQTLSLYHIETYYPSYSGYRSGADFIVTHRAGHQNNQIWSDGTTDYNGGTTSTETIIDGVKAKGWYLKSDEGDELLGHIIAWNVPEEKTNEKPQVMITPVAVFPRAPKIGVITGQTTDLVSVTMTRTLDKQAYDPDSGDPIVASSAPRRVLSDVIDPKSIVVVRGESFDSADAEHGAEVLGTTGIENVAYGQQDDGEVMYFTIQGIRVENPAPGQVYLVRRGNVVTKEYIK